MTDWNKFARDNLTLVSKLTDVLTQMNTPADVGEQVLLYLAGASAGRRDIPIMDADWVRPIAVGWQVGVESVGVDLTPWMD